MIDTRENLDSAVLLSALTEAGAQVVSPQKIRCPFHEDNSPSAGIYQGEDGAWRFKCHGGSCGFHGDVFDVRARSQNAALRDVLPREDQRPVNRLPATTPAASPERQPGPPPGYDAPLPPKSWPTLRDLVAAQRNVDATYAYTHPDTGRVDLAVLKIMPPGGKKEFRQCHETDAGWVMKKPKGLQPIYNRTRIRQAKEVIVVEGEKCVHALTEFGYTATTSPGGCSKGRAAEADWTPLAGKTVYLWPDNDTPDDSGFSGGIEHMKAVAGELEKLNPVPTVLWIDPATLKLPAENGPDVPMPPKGDAADLIAACAPHGRDLTRDALRLILDQADLLGPSRELGKLIEETISGQRVSIAWPWDHLTRLTQAMLPGTVTLLCGEPGGGKSFFLLQTMFHLHEAGVPTAMFQLEDGIELHLNRLLAQIAGNANLTDTLWVKEHPEIVRAAYQGFRDRIDSFARRLTAEADETPEYATLLRWVDKKLAAGCRVICIDPITVCSPAKEPWAADKDFIIALKRRAVAAKASVILATHPKKQGKTGSSLDDLAGGAAFARFSHCILWLRSMKAECVQVDLGYTGTIERSSNRTIEIVKARNSRGAGVDLAFWFDADKLCFDEQGPIARK